MKLPKVALIVLFLALSSALFGAIRITKVSAANSPVLPSGIANDIPITITNNQASATPSPFQQRLTVDSAAQASFEASNLQNVEFFSADGTIIPSWLESGNSNTATNTIYWLSLHNGIPASASITVYMGFASITTSLFDGSTVGEAPNLSPSYGQYDNGASIFNFYDNFAGTTLGSTWTSYANGGIISVNNGLTIQGTSGTFCGYNVDTEIDSAGAQFTGPSVFDIYFAPGSGSSNFRFGFRDTGLCDLQDGFAGHGYTVDIANPTNVQLSATNGGNGIHNPSCNTIASGWTCATPGTQPVTGNNIFSIAATSSSAIYSLNNLESSAVTISTNTPSYSSSIGIGLEENYWPNPISVTWVRTRNLPPNGIMPMPTQTYPNCGAPVKITLAQFESSTLNQVPDMRSLNPPCSSFYELDNVGPTLAPYTGDCGLIIAGLCDIHVQFPCSITQGCLFEEDQTWLNAGFTYPTTQAGDKVSATGFFNIDRNGIHELHPVATLTIVSGPPPPSGLTVANAVVDNFQTSLTLPSGGQTYIYGLVTGGIAGTSTFVNGEYASVANADGYLVAALAVTPSNTNSFTTPAAYPAIGGVSVSGFSSYTPSFGSNGSPAAPSASNTFTVTVPGSLVVVVADAGGEQSITISGVPALGVDATNFNGSCNQGLPPVIWIGHAFANPGTYTVTEQTSQCAAGQDPNHAGDLIGVFVFLPTSGSTPITIAMPSQTLLQLGGVTFRTPAIQFQANVATQPSMVQLQFPTFNTVIDANSIPAGTIVTSGDVSLTQTLVGVNAGDIVAQVTTQTTVQVGDLTTTTIPQNFATDITQENSQINSLGEAAIHIGEIGLCILEAYFTGLCASEGPVGILTSYCQANQNCQVTTYNAGNIRLLVTAPNGGATGETAAGLAVTQIANSWYSGIGSDPQIVWINDAPTGNYVASLRSSDTLSYTFGVAAITGTNTLERNFNGTISPGEELQSDVSLGNSTLAASEPRVPMILSNFFTDGNGNPLLLDRNGNSKLDVVLSNGKVRGTNPGQVLAWANVTNSGFSSRQSLKLNETLPVDWAIHPPWMPAQGGIHVFFVFANGTRLDITNQTGIIVTTGNPQTLSLTIANMTATSSGTSLAPGESILLSVKLNYALKRTSQTPASYPRNYTDAASAAAWTQPSFAGGQASGTASAFFTAYAKVPGDVNGDGKVDILDVALVAHAFGSQPGDARWNPAADLTNDGVIDIQDVALVAFYFGTHS